MNLALKRDAEQIISGAIRYVLPEAAVHRALMGKHFDGDVYMVAVGKAAWRMAKAAVEAVDIKAGIVVTKYGHVEHQLPHVGCLEAGHPVPDENGVTATQTVLDMTAHLTEKDTVLFLLSGGASALFEQPLIPLAELQEITQQLLASGADITEINTIRKRLSAVKGGKFALHCAPAHVEAVVLSDVLGDPLDMIASGPVTQDSSTCADAAAIAEKYTLRLTEQARRCLQTETPKAVENTSVQIVGNVRDLCKAAAEECAALGYEPVFLTDLLSCEAREAGRFLAAIVRAHAQAGKKLAFLAGGETVVHLTGKGKGGRNQELALAACEMLAGIHNAAVISVGSDGTDGPTDAAGGYVDGDSLAALRERGFTLAAVLQQNDAYTALQAIGGLIITGPTGTNVNDVAIGLVG